MTTAQIIAKLVEAGHEDLAEELITGASTILTNPQDVQEALVKGINLYFEQSKRGSWIAWVLDKKGGKRLVPLSLPDKDLTFDQAKKAAEDVLKRLGK